MCCIFFRRQLFCLILQHKIMARIVGIDYGAKRCGIAVTDEFQIIASALTTVETLKLFDFLKKYFSEEKVEKVVVGEPKDLRGNDTHGTAPVKKFIGLFKKQFPAIELVMVDERFTSKMASQSILMSGVKKMDRQNKGLIDQVSATIILQYYMGMKK
jgi:putative holliday junction resolvase